MMSMQSLFLEFNPSKFIVYSCLLVFTTLLALRLDGTISISYWSVFMPLWIWKCITVVGAVTGTIVWARNPDYRLSESSYIAFKSMLISLSLQLLLLMFELLVCDKLESGRHLWTLAFIPLIFVSLLSVAITVWSLKNDRSFELELFCAVNVLQFLFIALRLDNLLTWSWVVVFVPFWVLITLAVIGVLYALIFAAILLRTPEVATDQRRASFQSAVSYSLVVLPLLCFLVLLSNKLDYNYSVNQWNHSVSNSFPAAYYHQQLSNNIGGTLTLVPGSLAPPPPGPPPAHLIAAQLSYLAVCTPLCCAFIILICLSFGTRGGNYWWFGMRRDFCSFLLILCPCLRVYGNISYNKQTTGDRERGNNHSASDNQTQSSEESGISPNDRRRSGGSHRSSSGSDQIHHSNMIKTCLKGTIVCQPKKGSTVILAPPHISIESPD